MSDPRKAVIRRFLVHFGGAMLAYTVTISALAGTFEVLEVTGWRAAALSLTPMVPALYALHAFVVRFRAGDEFLRRVESEALLWAAGIVGFTSFGYGFLELSIDAPQISMIWVLPALIATYGPIYGFLMWRSR